MKTQTLRASLFALALCHPALFGASAPARSSMVPDRIGVYDSRAIAYAYFWQPSECIKRATQMSAARAARTAGDPTRFKQVSRALEQDQRRAHLQVFSTASATEAMAALAPRLPALQTEFGVTRLASKWDAPALRPFRPGEQIDVTDQLVREFITPTAKQQQVRDAMKTKPPLALWKAKALAAFHAR